MVNMDINLIVPGAPTKDEIEVLVGQLNEAMTRLEEAESEGLLEVRVMLNVDYTVRNEE